MIIYGSLETISGGYLYDRKLVEFLRAAGDQVQIVSLPWRTYSAHLRDNLDQALFALLRELRVDLLLQDELNHPSLFWLNQRLRRLIGYPIISIVHHLRSSEARAAWQNTLYRLPERAYLKTVDGFVFNSQTTKQVVTNLIGLNKPHVVAVPAGDRFGPALPVETIQQRVGHGGPLRLVFVGNLIERKGLHTLIDALAQLDAPSYMLTVVGSPTVDHDYAARVKNLVQSHGLTERIRWTGAIADSAALGRLLVEQDVLVVPSSYEGYGIVYLEGMGFGLPAIGTTGGAAHEIIRPGTGFLIEPGDSQTLAEHLSSLINNREGLHQMSLAARQRFLNHPRWADSMAAIRAFLLEQLH
ncbi:MAG: glycosyltransferase family 4 protein [Chloroflexi bacterium]|nr:glycosyltransferase family 4 protein [Chloroflexota bacterium]